MYKICLLLLGCFFSDLAAQTIVRGPYLQQPTAEGITIRWRTDTPTDSKVWYYAATAPNQVLSRGAATRTTEHEVTLSGMPRDTKYLYEVGTSAQVLRRSQDQFFVTAPPPTTRRPIRFWAMGDFGASNTAQYTSNQQAVRGQFLAKKNGPVDLWVWLGDNAYCCGTESEYQAQVFDFYGETILGNLPILPSPGNHEYLATPTATAFQDRNIPYYDIVTVPTKGESGGVPSGSEAFYSVDYGNVHFISLDSYGFDEGKYPLYNPSSLQYQWLEKDLAANAMHTGTDRWTVVFFHHPPYTKRSHDSDVEVTLIELRKTLVPLFDRYRVDLVLSGHSHVYERSYLMKDHTGYSHTFDQNRHVVQKTEAHYTRESKPIINKNEGTVYMVIGSAGRLDWNGSTIGHPSSAYAHYEIGGSELFTVNGNRLDGEWICADGQIRDRFTMFKNVSKRVEKQINFGESVELAASWPGTYRWSTGQINVSTITLQPERDLTVTVHDSLGYLTDTFLISVKVPPVLGTPTGAEEYLLYPNPGNGRVRIGKTIPASVPLSVSISDMTGKKVLEKVLLSAAEREVDIQFLPAGTYIVQIQSATQTWTRRLLKR